MDTEKLIREVLEFSAKTGFGTKTSIKEATEEFLLANPKYRSRKPAEQRLADFVNEIAKFKEKYDRELLVKFYNHWSQKGEKDLKFHWEKQKTFEVGKDSPHSRPIRIRGSEGMSYSSRKKVRLNRITVTDHGTQPYKQ